MIDTRTVVCFVGFSVALAAGCGSGETGTLTTSSETGGAGGDTSSQHGGGHPSSSSSTSSSTASSTSSSGSTASTSSTSSTSSASSTSSTSASSSTSSSTSSSSSGGGTTGLHVSGNKLLDGTKVVRLLGVNHSGSEYMCLGGGFFDGPVDQASVSAIKSWHANAVRVPLNEDCWLAINGAPAASSGSSYQNAIAQYVDLLRQNGLYVILELHWNAGGTNLSNGQQPMADSDHAPAFWTSVANAFKSDRGVVFDLYNEPHDIAWSCWQNGGCQVNGWNVAGMNQLIQAVRSTGAQNVVMAGGLGYSGDLSGWLANKPTDSTGNLVASFHNYNFTGCGDTSCWSSQVQPVANVVPLVTGELGENDCAHGYIDSYMSWADSVGISYLGWAWNTYDCGGFPSLISNFDGTPTAFGAGLQAHLATVNP